MEIRLGPGGDTFLDMSGRRPDPIILPPKGHTRCKHVSKDSGSYLLFRAGRAKAGRIRTVEPYTVTHVR